MDSCLVRYVATKCRTQLNGYTHYVENVSSCLQDNNMVGDMLSEPAFTKKVTQLPHGDGRRISYEIMYSNSICGISYTWYINMDFFERDTGIELRVNIVSQTYIMSVGDEYLTKLTQLIEQCIGGDWGVFVRVIDAYSDMLNMLLFPDMHRVENTTRRVVAGLMTSMYGVLWWKENSSDLCSVEVGDDCAEADAGDEDNFGCAVSDDTILRMNLVDFCRIINEEWKTIFSEYFSEEFLENIHRLSEAYTLVRGNNRSDTHFYNEVKDTIERINRELINVLWKVEQIV